MTVVAMEQTSAQNPLPAFLDGFSIEVMPRTADKVADFKAIFPAGTRIYIAHIDGTPVEDMRRTAARLHNDGFEVMPHFPARIIKDRATLENWISEYAKIGVKSALVLAGGVDKPVGEFSDSMQLLETGLFEEHGYTRIHVAGHPEGNKDIDPKGGNSTVMDYLRKKDAYAKNSSADMAIVTQFAFEAEPVIEWANSLREAGIEMPIHIGVAGPAKLQTMIKFSMACGVGPSIRVLQRRAKDLTKLMLPFKPDGILADLAAYKTANPDFNIEKVHFFPLGGIGKSAEYVEEAVKG